MCFSEIFMTSSSYVGSVPKILMRTRYFSNLALGTRHCHKETEGIARHDSKLQSRCWRCGYARRRRRHATIVVFFKREDAIGENEAWETTVCRRHGDAWQYDY
jgi:hypothetical protein